MAVAEPFNAVGGFEGRIAASGPDRGPVVAGRTAEFTGRGFAPEQPATLRQNGEDLNGGAPFNGDSEGNLTATVDIPEGAEGRDAPLHGCAGQRRGVDHRR